MTNHGEWKDGWYVVEYDVHFNHLDYFGHVNNAVFFTYFEVARTSLWLELTGGTQPGDINFIVAHAQCDFRDQLRMERIGIAVRFGELRNTSLDFVYEIRKNGGAEIAATGKVTIVLYDWVRRSKMPISEELRRKITSCSNHPDAS